MSKPIELTPLLLNSMNRPTAWLTLMDLKSLSTTESTAE